VHPAGRSSFYDPTVSWASLIGYIRAVRQFAMTRSPRLPASSLARITAAEGGDPAPPRYLQVPGGRLGYRRYPAETTRRALVLIHGSAGFGEQFQTLARLIARWDLAQVYTLDMRGHGLSDGPRGHAVDGPSRMVEDVVAFVAHLRETGAAERVILGGHSAGGGLILGVSRHAPELADAYLFMAPFLGVDSPTNRAHFGGWVKVRPFRLLALMAANLFGVSRFNQATVLDFDAQARARDPRYVAGWSLNTLLAFGPGRWMKRAPPIPVERPVLVLAGTGDECFRQPLYRHAFKVVAPHAEIPDVGACGHWDLLVDMKSIALIGAWVANQPETQAQKSASEPHLKKVS
jgi:alpha-beta hydrolase superfamily lysophospholipase